MARVNDLRGALPCLGLLEATPEILRGLMAELSEDDARWKPAPDRFSVAEVLAHLSHSEGHCYRARLDRFLAEDLPEFEPDDAQMHLHLYKDADPEEAFAHFEDQRENNLDLLRSLPAATGSRKAMHLEAGEITLSHMLHEWALHDLGHAGPVDRRGVPARVRTRRSAAHQPTPSDGSAGSARWLPLVVASRSVRATSSWRRKPSVGTLPRATSSTTPHAEAAVVHEIARHLRPASGFGCQTRTCSRRARVPSSIPSAAA